MFLVIDLAVHQSKREPTAQGDARWAQVCKSRCPHGGDVDRTWQSGGESSVCVCTCHETLEQHFVS